MLLMCRYFPPCGCVDLDSGVLAGIDVVLLSKDHDQFDYKLMREHSV